MIGSNPAHPGKLGESGENVVGEPEPDEHGTAHEVEEVDAGNAPNTGKGTLDGRVDTSVERGVKRDGNQGCRPDTVRGVDEETTANTRNTEADEVGGQGDENLVNDVRRIGLVKVLRQNLDPDDVVRVRGIVGDVCHDGDEHVLLLGERPRVKSMAGAKEGDAVVGEPVLAGLSNRVCEQLRDVCENTNGRLANVEELVNEAEDDGEEYANGPAADGGARDGSIVLVADDGANFGVRAVVGDEGGLKLHLLDEVVVLLRVGEDGVVVKEGLDLVDDGSGEVGIGLVDAVDADHHVANLIKGVLGGELFGLQQVIFGDVEFVLGGLCV